MFGTLLGQLAVWIVTGGSRPFHQTGEMDHKNKLLSTELLKIAQRVWKEHFWW
jgi:hypothetical protein